MGHGPLRPRPAPNPARLRPPRAAQAQAGSRNPRREGGRSWFSGRGVGPQRLRGPAQGAAPGGRTSTPRSEGWEPGPGRVGGAGGDATPQPPPPGDGAEGTG